MTLSLIFPMAGQGANLMASGAQYNIDPRLFVSLAGAETTFGNNITAGQFNAFNVLYNGMNSPFFSYQSAINSVGHSLTNPPKRIQLHKYRNSLRPLLLRCRLRRWP